MKKKLQREISELAAEIAKQGADFDVRNAKMALRVLYEKLTILEYLEGQLEDDSQSFDSKSYREKNWFTEPVPVPRPEHEEELVEPMMEKIKDLVAQMPQETSEVDELLEEVLPQQKQLRNDLEEFASSYQEMPVFERKEQAAPIEKVASMNPTSVKEATTENDRPKSLNDVVNTGLNVGLNDRIAFIKHLFDGSADDYARVISQINTMNSFEEAMTFIKGKIKPDYNFWFEKEEYAERFMNVIEKRFN